MSFESQIDRCNYKRFYLLSIETKNYKVMIGWNIFFDQPLKNDVRKYDNFLKIASIQGDDYTSGCLVDYSYYEKYYKLVDPKPIQQINFTRNLEENNAAIFFMLKKWKKPFWFFHGNHESIIILFCFNIMSI